MTGTNTYWIADADGTRALVEGADERDRWGQVHGWAEVPEPQPGDFVWLRNEDPSLGAARMTYEAAQLEAWSARGWKPGAPPEPTNSATAHWAAEEQPKAEPTPAPEPKSSAKASATSGNKSKE